MPVAQDANLDVVDSGLGLGNVLEPQSAFGAAFYQGFHQQCSYDVGAGNMQGSCSARLQAGMGVAAKMPA